MASLVYADRVPESIRCGAMIQVAKSAGIIADADVNGQATVTLLKAALLTNAPGRLRPLAVKVNLALDRAKSLGQVSETHGVTTVAALIALTDANTTMKQSFLG